MSVPIEATEVAVLGAGPYGMAIAAHLASKRIDHVVFGYPFSTWRDHMPKGMFLKSEPYGSDVAAPATGYGIRDFCERSGTPYCHRASPLPLSTFVSYSEWYERELVPGARQDLVASVTSAPASFHLVTRTGERLTARKVVVATGLLPFAHVPTPLRQFAQDLVTHTSAHSDLSRFRGSRVAVLGAGQSALETAVLLQESGADVEVLARRMSLQYNPLPVDRTRPLASLRWPMTPLCEDWSCWRFYHLPDLFRALPVNLRLEKAYKTFGPAIAPWLRERIEGRVAMRYGVRLARAEVVGTGIRLGLDGNARTETRYDHVIAGTGFRIDLDRLDFLGPELRQRVTVASGAPVLSRSFESSVPGLYFVGSMAAGSLGPNMRFLSGTRFTARRLVQALRASKSKRVPADVRTLPVSSFAASRSRTSDDQAAGLAQP
jgi:lysine/ornithine N-monooxygenase